MPGVTPTRPLSCHEMLLALDQLDQAAKDLLQSSDDIDIARDSIELKLEWLLNQIRALRDYLRHFLGGADGEPEVRPKTPKRVRSVANEPMRRSAAAQGIREYQFEWHGEKEAEVQINGQPLTFKRALAELLELLGKAEPEGWLIDDLARTLAVTAHALRQRISRLRDAFEAQGSNRFFIHTEGAKATARVRLLRRSPEDHGAAGGADAP